MNNIKPGDLVVVTKPTPCCGDTRSIGKPFRVAEIGDLWGTCRRCGKFYFSSDALDKASGKWFPVSRLTRIDPLPESETQDNHESLPA